MSAEMSSEHLRKLTATIDALVTRFHRNWTRDPTTGAWRRVRVADVVEELIASLPPVRDATCTFEVEDGD